MDDATPLFFPQFAPLYHALLPWAEMLLRVVVGLTLVPHGLRSAFGMFASTGGQSHNIAEFVDELDRGGYHPGKFWAPAIVLTQVVAGPMLAVGTVHSPRCLPNRHFSHRDQLRTLASGWILLEQDGSRIHVAVDHERLLLPNKRRWRNLH